MNKTIRFLIFACMLISAGKAFNSIELRFQTSPGLIALTKNVDLNIYEARGNTGLSLNTLQSKRVGTFNRHITQSLIVEDLEVEIVHSVNNGPNIELAAKYGLIKKLNNLKVVNFVFPEDCQNSEKFSYEVGNPITFNSKWSLNIQFTCSLNTSDEEYEPTSPQTDEVVSPENEVLQAVALETRMNIVDKHLFNLLNTETKYKLLPKLMENVDHKRIEIEKANEAFDKETYEIKESLTTIQAKAENFQSAELDQNDKERIRLELLTEHGIIQSRWAKNEQSLEENKARAKVNEVLSAYIGELNYSIAQELNRGALIGKLVFLGSFGRVLI